jgi:hypothetical protein
MTDKEIQLVKTPKRNWRFSGSMKLYASFQDQCQQTVLYFEFAKFL